MARCASDPVCGGTIRPLGFPVPRGMHYRAMWRRALLQGRDGSAYVTIPYLIGGMFSAPLLTLSLPIVVAYYGAAIVTW